MCAAGSKSFFYASGMIADGGDVATVQKALGHATPAITLNTYTHLWPKAEDRTCNAAQGLMNAAFDDSPKESPAAPGEQEGNGGVSDL